MKIEHSKKDNVIKSFFELLQIMEYEDIVISDIAKKSNISRRTFYRMYKNKSDLLDSYLLLGRSYHRLDFLCQ